jgi:drug/metabolite transporter (DMT)-like permease
VALLVRRGPRSEAPLRAGSLGRLALIAAVGGVAAPALLVLGLRRIDAASGSMLLALETPWTVLLAWLVHREHVGRRVLVAGALLFAGAVVMAGRPGQLAGALGALLVAAAALAWALDNVLSRPLADRDPLAVVAAKGALGAAASAAGAALLRDPWPGLAAASVLLVVGGFAFGVSLQLYLRAQRAMGAARTASVFAAAPLLGAAASLLFGTPWPGWSFVAASVLVAGGLGLHATERHGHAHTHTAMVHEHAHTHDDGHHDHPHDPLVTGVHTHAHRHDAVSHTHAHAPDLHHRHEH